MQFIYDKNAKNELLKIEDENYNYIVKARRHKLDDILDFRNLEDDFLYSYKISQIDKKSLFLNLLKKEEKIIENSKKIHLAWCVVILQELLHQFRAIYHQQKSIHHSATLIGSGILP